MNTADFRAGIKQSADSLQKTFGVDRRAATGIASLEGKLKKQAALFGMSGTEAELYKLKLSGVPDAALGTVTALSAHIKSLESAKRVQESLAKSGAATFEATRTPVERYRSSVADLKAQLKAGAIDQDTFNRAVKQAKDTLPQAEGALTRLGKGAAVAFAAVAAASAVAAAGLAHYVSASLQALDDTGDLAARLGTSTKAFTQLRYATQLTGSSAEDLAPAIAKLNDNLGTAAHAGGPVKDALARIGLDAKTLVGLDPADAFKRIAGGFASIPNPAERASLAMDLFGKGGSKLLNTLSAGPEELDRLALEADKLGISFDDLAAGKAGAANDALDKIKLSVGGLWQTLAINLAPTIVAVGDSLVSLLGQAKDSASGLTEGFLGTLDPIGALGSAIGVVADVIGTLRLAWLGAQAAITRGIAVLLRGFQATSDAIGTVVDYLPGVAVDRSKHQQFGGMAADLDKTAAEQYETFQRELAKAPPSEGINKFFDGLKSKARDAASAITGTGSATRALSDNTLELASDVSELKEKLQLSIDTFGMTSEQIDVFKLKQKGANDELLKGVTAQAAQLKGLEDRKKEEDKLKDTAKSLIDSAKTPLDKYEESLGDIKKSLEAGLLTPEQASKAIVHTQGEFGGESAGKFAGAMDYGSQEARSTILAYSGLGGKEDGIRGVEKNTASQVKLLTQLVLAVKEQRAAQIELATI